MLQPAHFLLFYCSCSVSIFPGCGHTPVQHVVACGPLNSPTKSSFPGKQGKETKETQESWFLPPPELQISSLFCSFTHQEPNHPLISTRPQGRGMSCRLTAEWRCSSHAHQCRRGGWSCTNPAPGRGLLPHVPMPPPPADTGTPQCPAQCPSFWGQECPDGRSTELQESQSLSVKST